MKLIYIANVRLPGDWAHCVQIMKTCEAFARRGLEIELATGLKKGSDEEIFSYFNIKKKFKISQIFSLNFSETNPGKINFFVKTLSFIFFAKLRFWRTNFDILYFRTHLAGLFFDNYFLEVHDLPRAIKFWHRRAFHKAKKIIVLTKFLKQRLMDEGVEANRIIVAPDAVDISEFNLNMPKESARQKLSLSSDKKIIAYCGDFSYHDWKGVNVLLESLKFLRGTLCLLVGGDPREASEIKKMYPADNLLITGRVAHSQVPLYLAAADVLILPNKKGNANSEYYTSPLKLFEYMASGRPIIASSLPSIKEALNEKNAVLVESDNPEELGKGILKVFNDEKLAKELTKQALEDVKNFSWEKRAEKILDCIS